MCNTTLSAAEGGRSAEKYKLFNYMLKLLERRYYKKGGSTKYYMNCNNYSSPENARKLIISDVLVYKQDTGVLEAVATDETIRKKNKHIVIKIGPEGKTVEQEYQIGQLLYEANLPGFIKFICKFSCLDNTDGSKKIQTICSATDDIVKNRRDVLIMPYIQEGSIKRGIWTEEKIPLLKTLLIQTLVAVCIAYMNIGFIHNDLHLDNILYKKTKKEYFYDGIPSNGYKVVIMDFEGSMVHVDRKRGAEFYWQSIRNFISRVNTDLYSDKNGGSLVLDNVTEILKYIDSYPEPNEINHIINLIMNSNFRLLKKPSMESMKYDPNVF